MTNVTADPKREAMLEKVRALIDKAEKTNFAEEAEAFMFPHPTLDESLKTALLADKESA